MYRYAEGGPVMDYTEDSLQASAGIPSPVPTAGGYPYGETLDPGAAFSSGSGAEGDLSPAEMAIAAFDVAVEYTSLVPDEVLESALNTLADEAERRAGEQMMGAPADPMMGAPADPMMGAPMPPAAGIEGLL